MSTKTAEQQRISVKVTFEDGNSFVSTINTDLEGAKAYYLGNVFNVGNGPDDKLSKCIAVEEVA